MSQSYRSYHFYDVADSDKEENLKKPSSKLAKKLEKKNAERMHRGKKPSSDDEQDEEHSIHQISSDSEFEYESRNKKKVKTEGQDSVGKNLQLTKTKSENNQDPSTSNNTPDALNLKISGETSLKETTSSNELEMKERLNSQVIGRQNTPLTTNNMDIVIENNQVNTPLGAGVSIQEGKGSIPSSDIFRNSVVNTYTPKQDTSASPEVKKSYVPNNFDYASLLENPKSSLLKKRDSTEAGLRGSKNSESKKKEEREKRDKKQKSRKYSDSSSSSSRSPSPVREKQSSSKKYASSESRQKGKLSSHLQSIRESMKNAKPEDDYDEDDDSEAEVKVSKNKNDNKPKFFIDMTPLGTIEQEGENKKLQTQERDIDSNEKQYRVIGQERAFRTQEKNLLDKLEKFLVAKEEIPEEKKEEAVDEENLELVEDEFNFESRYFMYNPTKVCNRCKRPGHFEKWCPDDITIKCMFCVGSHRTDNCTQIVCFHCYGVGHRARDCDAPGSLLCFRCSKKGHKSANCGMLVMKEAVIEKEKKSDSGDIKCMKCKRYGHVTCAKDTPQNRANKAWFDGLYKEENEPENKKMSYRERLNMSILARAKEAEKVEFEGALSDGSYEDLSNFKKASRPSSRSTEHKHKDSKSHGKYKHEKKKKKRFYQ